MKLLVALLLATAASRAAEPIQIPYSDARGVIAALGTLELKSADANAFATWARAEDASIRARLDQGELDSMVNLLLFGTSFTKQPRMTVANLAEESRSGLLRMRLDDLLAGLKSPRDNERLAILRNLLIAQGHAPGDSATEPFILENVQRSLKENITIATQIAAAKSSNNAVGSRGVSIDTTILPDYAIASTLAQLKHDPFARVAVIGPGLDFIDKEAGFDYYPLQTLQPFSLQSILPPPKLGTNDLRVTILDISPLVLDHVKLAKDRAARGEPYTIHLTRVLGTKPGPIEAFWSSFGNALAHPVNALKPPANLPNVETRAVQFPPASVLALDTANVNIVTQRLNLPPAEKFDLIIATNILIYYDQFEQALAATNLAAMLKPNGILLTNDKLPSKPNNGMRLRGSQAVVYTEAPRRTDTIQIYQR